MQERSLRSISGPYFAIGAASEAAGSIFASVVAAEAIDQSFAQALSEATEDAVVPVSEHGPRVNASRPADALGFKLGGVRTNSGGTDRFINTRIGNERRRRARGEAAAELAVSIIILQSR